MHAYQHLHRICCFNCCAQETLDLVKSANAGSWKPYLASTLLLQISIQGPWIPEGASSLCPKFFSMYDEAECAAMMITVLASRPPHPSKLPPTLNPCPYPCTPLSNKTHCPYGLLYRYLDHKNIGKSKACFCVLHICMFISMCVCGVVLDKRDAPDK